MLVRIIAALVAAALYVVFWWLVGVGVLFFATWRKLHLPGYHEPGVSAWWGWLVVATWWIGASRSRLVGGLPSSLVASSTCSLTAGLA